MEDSRREKISKYAGISSLRMLVALSGQHTIFPFYHTVSDRSPAHLKHLYACPTHRQFEDDLEFMLRYFKPVSIQDYLASGPSRKRQMVLSFDDGLIECHEYIAPYLRQKGIPALFFLNNDFIDNRDLFYRYKASILVDFLGKDNHALLKAAEYLYIPMAQVKKAILMINDKQQPLLDSVSLEVGFDPAKYLKENPVYMSSEQVKDLLKWGFQLGGHSTDHKEIYRLEPRKIAVEISKSLTDLQSRFLFSPACFAFPFTSDGVPSEVIDEVLGEGIADALFGTAGLKYTGRPGFVQRIPMESFEMPARKILKTEYLYYLLKSPLGRNQYFKGR